MCLPLSLMISITFCLYLFTCLCPSASVSASICLWSMCIRIYNIYNIIYLAYMHVYMRIYLTDNNHIRKKAHTHTHTHAHTHARTHAHTHISCIFPMTCNIDKFKGQMTAIRGKSLQRVDDSARPDWRIQRRICQRPKQRCPRRLRRQIQAFLDYHYCSFTRRRNYPLEIIFY